MQYLAENGDLIEAAHERLNLGRLHESLQYQLQLQQNLCARTIMNAWITNMRLSAQISPSVRACSDCHRDCSIHLATHADEDPALEPLGFARERPGREQEVQEEHGLQQQQGEEQQQGEQQQGGQPPPPPPQQQQAMQEAMQDEDDEGDLGDGDSRGQDRPVATQSAAGLGGSSET